MINVKQLRRTDDGYEEVLAEVTPAARDRDDAEMLMSEEMQPALEKTKRALVARRAGRGRGRPRRVVGGDSTGFALGEGGAGNSKSADGGLGMSTEMELSLGGETASGRRLLKGAAARESGRPRRSRHYTDVEIGGGEEEEEDAEDDDQVFV